MLAIPALPPTCVAALRTTVGHRIGPLLGALLIGAWLLAQAPLAADEVPRSSLLPAALPDPLQISLYRGLTSLRSGAFSGTWTERFETPHEGLSYEFSGKIRGLFDDASDCYALRRTTWERNRRTGTARGYDYGILRLPRSVVRYGEISDKVTTRTLQSEEATESLFPSGEYFDPRLVGYLWWGNLSRGDVLQLKGLSQIRYRTQKSSRTEEAGEGAAKRTRYEWEGPHMQLRLWVEEIPSEGACLPVKLSRRERYPDVDGNAWSDPLEAHEVSWRHVNGVHFPERLSLEEVREVLIDDKIPKTREERRFSRRKVAVTLEWDRINADIPRTEFAPAWLQQAP